MTREVGRKLGEDHVMEAKGKDHLIEKEVGSICQMFQRA